MTDDNTPWTGLLARLLDLVLSPVGVKVEANLPLGKEPPRLDILLLRREGPTWSEAQRLRLADGLRDTDAAHLLLEFKYTESLNVTAWQQILGYDRLYT